mgnify:CR=1 FL=1
MMKGDICVTPEGISTGGQGRSAFPAQTPIAMCYVPLQRLETVYEPETALKQGTLFPDLDKPFLGGRSAAR